jgi:hypothetical protein
MRHLESAHRYALVPRDVQALPRAEGETGMSLKLGPVTDQMIETLKASKAKWDILFRRHGFDCDMGHESNIAFARVVEREHAVGHQVDFPIARQMFMLGYMTAQQKER